MVVRGVWELSGAGLCGQAGHLSLNRDLRWPPKCKGWLQSAGLAGVAWGHLRLQEGVCLWPHWHCVLVATSLQSLCSAQGLPLHSTGANSRQWGTLALSPKAPVRLGPQRKPRASESMQ